MLTQKTKNTIRALAKLLRTDVATCSTLASAAQRLLPRGAPLGTPPAPASESGLVVGVLGFDANGALRPEGLEALAELLDDVERA